MAALNRKLESAVFVWLAENMKPFTVDGVLWAAPAVRTWRDAREGMTLPAVIVHVLPERAEFGPASGPAREAKMTVEVFSDPRDDLSGEIAGAVLSQVQDLMYRLMSDLGAVQFAGAVLNGITFDDAEEMINEDGFSVSSLIFNVLMAKE